MAKLLTGSEFADLFCTFGLYAWRWESAPGYADQALLEQISAGAEPHEIPRWATYLDRVRAYRKQGDFGRACADDDPLTDYQRLRRFAEPWHQDAGETILHLPRATAAELGLPGHDFWLFDGKRLVLMLWDGAGNLVARILIEYDESPETVIQHCVWRDLAIQHATKAVAGLTA